VLDVRRFFGSTADSPTRQRYGATGDADISERKIPVHHSVNPVLFSFSAAGEEQDELYTESKLDESKNTDGNVFKSKV